MDGDQLPCFSSLLADLHSSLEETTFTCQVLNLYCCNYQMLLKRWPVVREEENDAACNLSCDSSEDEDLVSNIDSIVEKAKVTRSMKIMKLMEKRNSETDSRSSTSSLKPNISAGGNRKMYSNRKIEENKNCMDNQPEKKISNYKADSLIKLRRNQSFKTTYQSDYSSGKLLLKYSKSRGCGLPSEPKSRLLNQNVSSELDVARLLKSVTIHASLINLESRYKTKNKHNYGTKKTNIPLYTTLKEAIYIIGVPSDYLKLLSNHHRFLQRDRDHLLNKKKIFSGSFLKKLYHANEKSWSASYSEPVVNLFSECSDVLNNILLEKTSNAGKINFVDLEEMLVSMRKNYQKVFDVESSPHNNSLHTKTADCTAKENEFRNLRALAGVWRNQFQIQGLKTLFILYKTKTDCKNLITNFQKIQKLQFQHDILCTLNTEVFPVLRELEINHLNLPVLYKTCCALCNMSTLSMPVIVKL